MKHILDEKQRSQALVWYAVLGFDLQTIADHYGVTEDQIRKELDTERDNRHSAGKSPEPVPVKQHPMERQRTHGDVLMECVTALLAIVEACNEKVAYHAVNDSRAIAQGVLKKAGILA